MGGWASAQGKGIPSIEECWWQWTGWHIQEGLVGANSGITDQEISRHALLIMTLDPGKSEVPLELNSHGDCISVIAPGGKRTDYKGLCARILMPERLPACRKANAPRAGGTFEAHKPGSIILHTKCYHPHQTVL